MSEVDIETVAFAESVRALDSPVPSPSLMPHAIETFGSQSVAESWLASECGDLQNRTPLEVIHTSGTETEVERILDCIDHGMLA